MATGWIPTQNLVQMSRMMMLHIHWERIRRFILYLCNEALQGEQGSPPPPTPSWSETDSVFSLCWGWGRARLPKGREGLLGLDSSTISRQSTRLFFFYQGFQLWTPKEEEVERLKSFQKSKSVVIIPLSNPYCDPLKLESSSQRRTLRFTEVRYLPRSSR